MIPSGIMYGWEEIQQCVKVIYMHCPKEKVEMCGMNKGTWIRVMGAVKEDTRREARVVMIEANKSVVVRE